jgi:hypothetical protein
MLIKDFQSFLNESMSGLHRAICAISSDLSDFDYVTGKSGQTRQFMKLFTRGDKSYRADLPVVNYCNIHTRRLIKAGTPEELVYNPEQAKMRIASKVDWHGIHAGSPHLPKTVTDTEELEELQFPIIAKPENRYSGRGIVKFDSLKEVKGADLSQFAVFSEQIDIAEEHRIPVWRGQPLMWMQRVPANRKTREMDKEADEKLWFNYVLKDLKGLPAEWNEVISDMAEKHRDLDFYSVDLAIDEAGKPWVIEMSSEFAPLFGVTALIYDRVYQDHYGRPLSDADAARLEEYRKRDIQATIEMDPDRFSVEPSS